MAADADVIRRMTNEVFLAGDLGALDELLADNLVDHDPPPGIPGTKDGWKQLAGMSARSPTGRWSSTTTTPRATDASSRAGQ